MANEGSTKPTYSELEAENLRVRGLLQRQWVPIESAPKTGEHILVAVFDGGVGFGTCGGKKQAWAGVVHYWEPDEPGWYMSTANGDIRVEPTHWQPIVPQSSSLVPEGAESADIGKLDAADEKSVRADVYSLALKLMEESTGVKADQFIGRAAQQLYDPDSIMAGSAETGGEKAE